MPDTLRAALVPRTRLVGTVLTLPGAAVGELLAEPFDFVWIDLEHAALGPREAQDMLIGAQAAGAHALVRLPAAAHDLMAVMLDAGVDGVVLAGVTGPDQAMAAAERVSHPPDGTRSWGPRRLALRGRGREGPAPHPSIWAQIESPGAVASAGEIAAVTGIDALVVGTADLSVSLGSPLDSASSELVGAVAAVRAAAEDAGVAHGVAGALDTAPETLCDGASILVHATDARICAQAVDGVAARLRGAGNPERQPAGP